MNPLQDAHVAKRDTTTFLMNSMVKNEEDFVWV